jgi:hypothetical protein
LLKALFEIKKLPTQGPSNPKTMTIYAFFGRSKAQMKSSKPTEVPNGKLA